MNIHLEQFDVFEYRRDTYPREVTAIDINALNVKKRTKVDRYVANKRLGYIVIFQLNVTPRID